MQPTSSGFDPAPFDLMSEVEQMAEWIKKAPQVGRMVYRKLVKIHGKTTVDKAFQLAGETPW
ncbi:MAG: hypothetical protein AB7D47_13065 [Desulfovibrio sp.]